MSSLYSMPPDTNEKEKIIGGVLTMGQIIWIGGGGIVCVLFILSLFRIFGWFSAVFGLPFLIVGLFFAFKKVNDLPLPTYLNLRRKYNNKIKHYINDGSNRKLDFSHYKE